MSISNPLLERHARAAEMLPNGDLLIGGSWRSAIGSGAEHINPSTGRAHGEFAMASPADIDEAVAGARAALPT